MSERAPLIENSAVQIQMPDGHEHHQHKKGFAIINTTYSLPHDHPDHPNNKDHQKHVEFEEVDDDDVEEEVEDLTSKPVVVIASLVILVAYVIVGTIFYRVFEPDWGIVNSLFFIVVTLTTVGYGDPVPTNTVTLLGTVVFILLGVALIGVALGVVGSYLLKRQEDAILSIMEADENEIRAKEAAIDKDMAGVGPLKYLQKLGMYFAVVIVFLAFGTIFFYYDQKDWTWVEAFYFSVVTVTTVGYGDYVPVGDMSRLVCTVYILTGTFAVVAALGAIADLYMDYEQQKACNRLLHKKLTVKSIAAMDGDNDGMVSESEFMEFMLVHLGKVNKDDILDIKQQFKKLDVDGSGQLDQADLEQMIG
eukprot:TRINITY_DN7376_c0_g1_i1.p1 TRINITY_DN7376_c0_g1~~TRINITY_DN7376_c0_g1_i1.p1  ORF type:complete len:363 (+),score=103.42 TRINITY_DN7376_c0_g1_i1:68-1156(+)